MKASRKITVLLALCALIPWTTQAETLADHLPADGEHLDLYIAQGEFMAAVPYGPTALINHPLTEHIAVTDTALRAKTFERLRAVRVTPDTERRSWSSCTDPHNPFGLWLLGNGTMLVLSLPLADLKRAKKDDYSSACLQIGDTSLWLKLSDADLWQTIKPLL